jgi:hypothetical protein
MTEAVAVIPVFLILFGALIFTHRLYSLKGASRADARHAVWSYALSSCESGPYTTAAAERTTGGDAPALDALEGGIDPNAQKLLDDAKDDPKTDLEMGDEWGVARVTVGHGPLVAPPPLTALGQDKVTTTMSVQCDEKPRGASAGDVLAFVWHLPETLALGQ